MPLDPRAVARAARPATRLIVTAAVAVLVTATPTIARMPAEPDAAGHTRATPLPPVLTARTTGTAVLLQLSEPAGQPRGVTYSVSSAGATAATRLVCRGPAPRSCLHHVEPGIRFVSLTVVSALDARRTTTRYTIRTTG